MTTPRLIVATLLLGLIAVAVGPRAFQFLDLRLTTDAKSIEATARARAAELALAPQSAQTAVAFQNDDSLQTFLDLGFGRDSLTRALARRDLTLYRWRVRLFSPGSADEAVLTFFADGRFAGFRRHLPDSLKRPALSEDSALTLATDAMARVGLPALTRYVERGRSTETKPGSGRVDHTFRWERPDGRLAGAPMRLTVVVSGDLVTRVHEAIEIPDRWTRRYAEMRTRNDQLAVFAQISIPIFLVLGLMAFWPLARTGDVRWRPALAFGITLGVLSLGAGLNGMSAAWAGYDTATSADLFRSKLVVFGVFAAIFTALYAALLVAVAETLTRRAFPEALDWYDGWRSRGAPEVRTQLWLGYALAAFGFAYVGSFYLLTQRGLGWWVPTGVLDDPNQIATRFPWVTMLAGALEAGVLEECLFRAIPLALCVDYGRRHPARARPAITLGVVGTSLLFGFGHANYPSWPAYSRGVELFAEAVIWALVYLRIGLLSTIVAHVLYDLTWFGLFALSGDSLAHRVTLGVALAAFAAPAILLAWRRGASATPRRFSEWIAAPPPPRVPRAAAFSVRALSPLARGMAIVTILAALIGALRPVPARRLGPAFTATPTAVRDRADSAVRAWGGDPGRFRVAMTTASLMSGPRQRFLREHRADTIARALARDVQPAAQWEVRYMRIEGTVAARAEGWRVRLTPDGQVLEVVRERGLAEAGATIAADSVRTLATSALRRAGIATAPLREVALQLQPRAARRDATLTFEDSSRRLPAGATSRVDVELAGAEIATVRRYIDLPESWERRDRAREDRETAIASVIALTLIILFGLALWRTTRWAPLLGDAWITQRATLVIAVVTVTAAIVTMANSRASQEAGWESTMPWSTYSTMTLLLTAFFAAAVLSGLGALQLTDAVRRRVGIPLFPSRTLDANGSATMLSGLALAAMPTALELLTRAAPTSRWFTAPNTVLDARWPWISGTAEWLTALPFAALLPLGLLIAGAWVRPRWARVLGIVVLSAALAIVAERDASVARWIPPVAGALAGLVGYAALRAWAGMSALTWGIAIVAGPCFSAIASWTEAASPQDRDVSVVLVGTALLLLAGAQEVLRRRAPLLVVGEVRVDAQQEPRDGGVEP
ncbi:MAG: CPBP family intramembrane metalloprotease [Gemmatimonadaceae bacterium]|nr:CPBP family intramembrane metalloprotease [Gemmatimonadaceae bacterium]